MKIEILKSKIHRAKITGANLNYIGSITIDRILMKNANLINGEKVSVVNINNGNRLDTYVIPGEENSGDIILNGAAARNVVVGDFVIIISYCLINFEKAKKFTPSVIFPNEKNSLLI